MKFSICHTTARPEQWGTAYAEWLQNAAHPEDVEYILVCDKRWGFTELPKLRAQDKVLWNTDRMCWVGGVNIAAAAATGDVLIVNSDDIFPCEHWDTKLIYAMYSAANAHVNAKHDSVDLDSKRDEFVVHVSSDTAADRNGLMVCPILSRARYERLGYAIYPEYESMYGDDDFSEHARLDNVVIDARHLVFAHRHPTAGHGQYDAVYQHQNKQSSYAKGVQILTQRRAAGFGSNLPGSNVMPIRKVIAVCLPGLNFPQHWVATWTELFGRLMNEYIVHPIFSYSTNVYATRISIAESILQNCNPKPDYILWIDDDNLVNSLHVKQLIEDIEKRPDLDGIAGWCWVLSNVGDCVQVTSVGDFNEKGGSRLWDYNDLMAGPDNLKAFECGGFPCFLMRYRALEAVGKNAFMPQLSSAHPFGFSGEDIAYFACAKKEGLKFAVDRRIKVPHLRLGSPEPPELVKEQQQTEQAVA